MNTKNIKTKSILIVVAVIVIIVASLFFYKKASMPAIDPVVDDIQIESTEDVATSTAKKISTPTISYKDALVLYKDKRIQLGLGDVCSATPNNVTYKNGTSIMIDNRAPISRTIKLGTTYSIKPYGFKIIKLTSSKLPVTWLMDCNKQQNVATVLVQK